MWRVDLEGADPCRIVYGRMMEASDLLATFSFEGQELDIHLDVMGRHPLTVLLGVDLPGTGSAQQRVEAVAAKNSVDARIGNVDPVIALKMPVDAHRPVVVLAP